MSNVMKPTKSCSHLRAILHDIPNLLVSIPPQQAATPRAPKKWSAKQELGHLIDSAANNHQRIVRAQSEHQPAMPGYDGDRWVEIHAYQQRDWNELINLWHSLNLQLLAAAEAAAGPAMTRTCTIAGSAPLTIEFILGDYLKHMIHHLNHIGIPVAEID